MKLPSHESGLTLLEVMVAMSIAAIALTTLLSLSIQTVRTGERVERTTEAVLLAQGLMARFESGAAPLPDNGAQGVFAPPSEAFRWLVNYSATPLSGLEQLALTVSWEGGSPEAAVVLDSYVFR